MKLTLFLFVFVCYQIFLCPLAGALNVSSNHNLSGGATIDAVEADSNVTPSPVPGGGATNGWLYDLGDRDGGGPGTDPVATGNLELGANKLYNTAVNEDLYFNLNGGDLAGSGEFAIMTKDDTGVDNGDITITNVKDIACGIIATFAVIDQEENAGNVQIGTASLPANLIRVDGIKTYGLYKKRYAADCTIYATNDVTIASSNGTPGSIEAHTGDPNLSNNSGGDGGDIDVFHDGTFTAGDLTAYSVDAQTTPNGGRIYLNGDWLGDGAGGSCVVSNLLNYVSRSTYTDPNRDITLTGYLSVHVKGDIDGRSTRGTDYHKSAATDVFITNIAGDIEIDGFIDLDYPSANNRGRLTLQTTGGGSIYVNDLDLTNMLYASFNAASGVSHIQGEISNFSQSQANLRCPEGDTIVYDEDLNPQLDGDSYTLADLDGTPGLGGTLAVSTNAGGGSGQQDSGGTVVVIGSSFSQPTDTGGVSLPENEWIKISDSELGMNESGAMRGPALLYVPPLDRFLAALGVQYRFDNDKTPCYSETTISIEEQVWKNRYPIGKDWGPETGPADGVPTFNYYGNGLKVDDEGVLRPHLRGGYGMPVWHQYCWDSDRDKAVFLFKDNLIEYDPVSREWSRLSSNSPPVEADLPGVLVGARSDLHWGALCYDPVNGEVLLFGGASTITERGDPGTWVYSIADDTWTELDLGSSELKQLQSTAAALKKSAQAMVAGCRNRYYHTEREEDQGTNLTHILQARLNPADLENLLADVTNAIPVLGGHEAVQAGWAQEELDEAISLYEGLLTSLDDGIDAGEIGTASEVKALVRRASISLASQPPQRCYSPMVFDPNTQKIVLFGGNHLDRCLADTWVYDTATRTWEERRPDISPSPRHSHGMLYLPDAQEVALVGGWETKLESHPALPPELWCYDVAANQWQLVERWSETGPFHNLSFHGPHCNSIPFAVSSNDVAVMQHSDGTWACHLDVSTKDPTGTQEYGVPAKTERMVAEDDEAYSCEWYDAAPAPDPDAMAAWLAALPTNEWVEAPQGGRQHPGYAYSTAAYNPDHDELLLWAGGHSTTHQTTIMRYSLATGTWHVDYPPQLPMSYGRTLWGANYAYGYRPWMPRHPWDGYVYDLVSDRLVLMRTSGPLMLSFNPDTGDFEKPDVIIPPDGGKNNATMGASSDGALLWTVRRFYRLDAASGEWIQLDVEEGVDMPKTQYYHAICYDSLRGNYVLFQGTNIYVYDPSNKSLQYMDAADSENAPGFVREIKYIPEEDIFLDALGGYWDPAENRWGVMDFDCTVLENLRDAGVTPDGGVCWDSKRKLMWIVKGKSDNVFVLRPDFGE